MIDTDDETAEQWMPAVGWVGYYEVSSCGRVRSVTRTVQRKFRDGTLVESTFTERFMRPVYDYKGYATVVMTKNGKGKQVKIHRLVALAFLNNPLNKPTVNHINGVKDDNRVENLEWSTHSENSLHAFATGLNSHKGTRNPSAILDDAKVMEIRRKCLAGQSTRTLANEYGVSLQTIRAIRAGRTWRHVTLIHEPLGERGA